MLGGGGGGGGGGSTSPLGVGINFCHPEVVKLQQQCHMQNTIFDLPQACWFYSFVLSEGECQYTGDSHRELEGKMEMTIQ